MCLQLTGNTHQLPKHCCVVGLRLRERERENQVSFKEEDERGDQCVCLHTCTTGSLWRSSSSLTRLLSIFWHFHISFRALKAKINYTERKMWHEASREHKEDQYTVLVKPGLYSNADTDSWRLENRVYTLVMLLWSPLVCRLGHMCKLCIVKQILCRQVHGATKDKNQAGTQTSAQTLTVTTRWWNLHHSDSSELVHV